MSANNEPRNSNYTPDISDEYESQESAYVDEQDEIDEIIESEE